MFPYRQMPCLLSAISTHWLELTSIANTITKYKPRALWVYERDAKYKEQYSAWCWMNARCPILLLFELTFLDKELILNYF